MFWSFWKMLFSELLNCFMLYCKVFHYLVYMHGCKWGEQNIRNIPTT